MFARNTAAQNGGAIASEASGTTVTNCTFYQNHSGLTGAFFSTLGAATLTNCIFWDNRTAGDGNKEIDFSPTASINVSYSIVDQDGYAGSDNNLRQDPLFLDPANADLRHLQMNIGHRCAVVAMPDRALLALQGPKAVTALSRLNADVAQLVFMSGGVFELLGQACFVTRSGYTGEDGFEISVASESAATLAEALLTQPEVMPAGLGARDTLRLEAGLCLYGHDIDETTSPVEAGLTWAMQKVRRPGGARAGHYPGAAAIERHLVGGAPRKRVGLVGLERVPVRPGTAIVDAHGRKLGTVTSGTLAPSVNRPIAMAYLPVDHAQPQHEVYAEVRGKRLPMRVTPMPFHPHRYRR